MADHMLEKSGISALSFFVGSWKGSGRFSATALEPERAIRCIELEAGLQHRGRWLVQRLVELDVPTELNPVDATRIWGYDASSGMFVCEWFDAHGRRGTVHSKGLERERLITTGTAVSDGRSVALREVFTRRADDEFQHVGEMDFGGGWIVTDEQVFYRAAR
jgi:uncharacterized protein YodC (DUF2158 family)